MATKQRVPRRPATYHHGDLERALLTASTNLVRKSGESGFSLRAVAGAAGVDPAAVYRHFDDKTALLCAVASSGFSLLAERMEASASSARTPEQRFLQIGDAYIRFALDEPSLFRLMFGPTTSSLAPKPGESSPTFALLESALAGLAEKPKAGAALTAWSSVHGLSTLLLDGRIRVDVDTAVREVLSLALQMAKD
jgi:AcrR family transcriptional regulator